MLRHEYLHLLLVMLQHSDWLAERLGQVGVAKPALNKGREVRLHKNVLEVAARIMHALYRPGHALLDIL